VGLRGQILTGKAPFVYDVQQFKLPAKLPFSCGELCGQHCWWQCHQKTVGQAEGKARIWRQRNPQIFRKLRVAYLWRLALHKALLEVDLFYIYTEKRTSSNRLRRLVEAQPTTWIGAGWS